MLLLCSGCATVTAGDLAGFYGDNYPKMTEKEKAQSIMSQFDTDRTPYSAVRKTYKVDCIFIYDYRGSQVFPDKGTEPKGTVIKTEIIKAKDL